MPDLWPNFEANAVNSPKAIMNEQASGLKAKTQGKLYARVTQTSSLSQIILNFQIVSPVMGNYKFSLFYVKHTIEGYPLTLVYDREEFIINNEEEFIERMRIIFNLEDTISKISTLMSYE